MKRHIISIAKLIGLLLQAGGMLAVISMLLLLRPAIAGELTQYELTTTGMLRMVGGTILMMLGQFIWGISNTFN